MNSARRFYAFILALLFAALGLDAAASRSWAARPGQLVATPQTPSSPPRPQTAPPAAPEPRGPVTPPPPINVVPETIGRLSGDDLEVSGETSKVTENGNVTWTIASGVQMTLHSGQARLELVEGGEIDFAAPAHLTLLKSSGGIVVALDYGLVRTRVDALVPLTIYTPLIIATPIAIGDGRRDVTVGLTQQGEMCALAQTGAARLTQQFSSQGVVLPQGADAHLTGGQLDPPGVGSLDCHFPPPISRTAPAGPSSAMASAAPALTAPPARPANASASAAAPIRDLSSVPSDGKLDVHVEMPALSFDASADAAAADPRPSPAPASRQPAPSAAPAAAASPAAQPANPGQVVAVAGTVANNPAQQAQPPKKHRSFFARLFGAFHRHKSPPVCEGADCPEKS